MIEGTDLSYANGEVDYQAMKAAGIRFAFIKVGQGTGITDPLYGAHKAGCKKVGCLWGPYFFCDYRYSPIVQAKRFAAMPGDDWGQLSATMDIEYEERLDWGRPSGSAMYDWGCQFITQFEIETQGKRTLVIYTNPDLISEIKPYLKPGDPFMRHGLYLAHWTSEAEFANFSPWPEMQYWQQAGDVKGSWSTGSVDYDYFIGTEEEFAALGSEDQGSVSDPEPTPIKATVTTGKLNFRKKGEVDNKNIITALPKGTETTVLEVGPSGKETWAHVQLDGYICLEQNGITLAELD